MRRAIGTNSVLPAHRRKLTLRTADGLRLVGEEAIPKRRPKATLVCVHPIPTHGGMMDSHVLRKAANRLPALADVAVIRFNTRGTSSLQGTSEGAFDDGIGERFDLYSALEYVDYAELPNVWLLGWSFGADLVLRHGARDPVRGAILLSPMLRHGAPGDVWRWTKSERDLSAIVAARDGYLGLSAARECFGSQTGVELVSLERGSHLWIGDADRVLDTIVSRIRPNLPVPLPRTWGGPMEMSDPRAYNAQNRSAFPAPQIPPPVIR